MKGLSYIQETSLKDWRYRWLTCTAIPVSDQKEQARIIMLQSERGKDITVQKSCYFEGYVPVSDSDGKEVTAEQHTLLN